MLRSWLESTAGVPAEENVSEESNVILTCAEVVKWEIAMDETSGKAYVRYRVDFSRFSLFTCSIDHEHYNLSGWQADGRSRSMWTRYREFERLFQAVKQKNDWVPDLGWKSFGWLQNQFGEYRVGVDTS